MSDAVVAVEALDRAQHDAGGFVCGNDGLDRWLQAHAGQAQRRNVARTYLAAQPGGTVMGYYTLVAAQVELTEAAEAVRTRLSRHFPIPVVLIARLAVASAHQGRGLGRDLLRDALRRVAAAGEQIGIRAVLVDAVDASAAAFYERHGFEPVTSIPLTLMIPLAAVRAGLR